MSIRYKSPRADITFDQHKYTCALCGEKAELRPYGPNGENICFACGMKDEATTGKRFMQTVFNEGFDA